MNLGGGGKGGPDPSGAYVSPGQQNQTAVARKDVGPVHTWQDQSGQWHEGSGPPQQGAFQQAAEAQTQSQRPTQNTPFASSQWTRDPTTGAWTQNVGLSGGLAGAATGLENQFAQANAKPLDTVAQARQHAEDAIYGRETSRLDPRFAQQEQQLGANLANSGVTPGDASYDTTMGNFNRAKNDAYQQAQFGAIQGGGQEAQRQQAMDITSREAPLQEMQGLQGMTQMPGVGPGTQYLPAAIAQYQAALQKYGIDQAGKNSMMQGLSGAGGSVGAAALA